MKNLFYFLLVVVMVVMNSCYCGGGFNEPQVPFSSNDIFGVWYNEHKTDDLYNCYVFNEDGTYGKCYVSTCHDKIPDILDGTYKFYKDDTNTNGYHIEFYIDGQDKTYPTSEKGVRVINKDIIKFGGCTYIRIR